MEGKDKKQGNVCMAGSCACGKHQEHGRPVNNACRSCKHDHKKGEACSACGCK